MKSVSTVPIVLEVQNMRDLKPFFYIPETRNQPISNTDFLENDIPKLKYPIVFV